MPSLANAMRLLEEAGFVVRPHRLGGAQAGRRRVIEGEIELFEHAFVLLHEGGRWTLEGEGPTGAVSMIGDSPVALAAAMVRLWTAAKSGGR